MIALIIEDSKDGRMLHKKSYMSGKRWKIISADHANNLVKQGFAKYFPSREQAEEYLISIKKDMPVWNSKQRRFI